MELFVQMMRALMGDPVEITEKNRNEPERTLSVAELWAEYKPMIENCIDG